MRAFAGGSDGAPLGFHRVRRGGVLAATLFGLVFAPVAFHAVASLTHERRRPGELRRKRAQRQARRAAIERGAFDESPTA